MAKKLSKIIFLDFDGVLSLEEKYGKTGTVQ